MMKTGTNRINPGGIAALAVILLLAGTLPAFAQTEAGRPQDLEFEIINATTGRGGTVERMTIDYVTTRRNNVVDVQPADTTFTEPDVPVLEGGKYVITVWRHGVPYWWSKRGRELVAGPVTLHVFDAVSSLDGVAISGLNLVIRRQESLLHLEYMLQIDNLAKPQVTVVGSPATFELALPAGASSIEASYTRGPDPMPVAVDSPGSHSGLAVPLTPGQNLIRIEAVVPWSENLELPVGSDLPVTSWSVLASPEWLEVGSTDIEENTRDQVSGFRRYAGFPLESGEMVNLHLTSGEHEAGPDEDLFTKDAPAEKETDEGTTDTADKNGGKPLPLIFMFVVIVVILVAVRRRRS
ncbi:MAG: hypothetical protein KAH56_13250 [Candidatus Krumholzibacteria bacterium]|nr:hypothetical protein [Candidatus Krumholzibacteria bacterium]